MRLAPLTLCLAAACTASMPPAEPEEFVFTPAEPDPAYPRPATTGIAITELPRTPPTSLQVVASVAGRSIGSATPGRVAWLAGNARFAAITVQPTRDEPCDPRDRPTLHDLETGHSERLESLTAIDPRGRYLVFAAGARLWLLDSDTGARTQLAARGAAPRHTGGPCVFDRRAAFDATGRHLTYLRGARSAEQVIWHDLATGHEVTVALPPAARPLWRAEPSVTPGWLRVFSVPIDNDEDGRRSFPTPEAGARPTHHGPDAVQSHTLALSDTPPLAGEAGHTDFGYTPLGTDLFAALHYNHAPLTVPRRASPSLPPECRAASGIDGSPAVLLHCNPEDRLWWPRSHHTLELTSGGLLGEDPHRADDGHLWLAARVSIQPHQTHLVRVDTTTATAFAGPRILLDAQAAGEEFMQADRRGWLYFNNPAGLLAHHVATGATRAHLGAFADKLRPGAAELHGRWYALDPARARMHPLPAAPLAVADNGCALVGSNPTPVLRATRGPWTLHCPQP